MNIASGKYLKILHVKSNLHNSEMPASFPPSFPKKNHICSSGAVVSVVSLEGRKYCNKAQLEFQTLFKLWGIVFILLAFVVTLICPTSRGQNDLFKGGGGCTGKNIVNKEQN